MRTVKKIKDVIDSGVLLQSLCEFPKSGVSEAEIKRVEALSGVSFPAGLVELLYHWNGLNLDVIRIHSIDQIVECLNGSESIEFASDPSGFIFKLTKDGNVVELDTDCGLDKNICESFEEFICDYVFGSRADEFCGHEWLQELVNAGLVNKT